MKKRIKEILGYTVFLIGWLLSPLTLWNDVLINLPLSYLAASGIRAITGFDFKWLLIGCYWLSNILGVVMMLAGGREIFVRGNRKRAIIITIGTMIIYSLLVFIAVRLNWIRPVDEWVPAQ